MITCQLLEKCLNSEKYWMLSYGAADDEDDDDIGSSDNFKLHYDMTASDTVDQENLSY